MFVYGYPEYDHSAVSSSLLLEARLREKIISIFLFSVRYATPPAPPSAGSPWLDPSKYAQGIVLFIFDDIIIFNEVDLGMFLCSITFCMSMISVISSGV